ncbi:MAG TPA: PDDEXK nuclease domain-containing protein [Parafilimonas sp.]|nr:PDDEXK nuclease domain-containing protein [Parafilimonas sp.]
MSKIKNKYSETQIAGVLYKEVAVLIERSREKIALTVNQEVTLLYWHIGKVINEYLLKNKRAGYGETIVATVSQQLTVEYGKGFNKSNLHRMINFHKTFREEDKIATLSQQLSWSHFIEILTLEEPLKRGFYLELCKHDRWSVRVLRERISSMLYERTALSKKPEELIRKELEVLKSQGPVTTDLVFRDPYILDFLGLQDTYSESDLEAAILNQLQHFIIELGTDFAFIARQKRIVIDNEDHKIDLLFYHRGLKRLVAIDLKLDRFKAAFKGQMELYLKWLDKYERRKDEESPLGLILCSKKQQEQIELLELNQGEIRVAEYITQLPSKELLAKKLHAAIELAKEKNTNNEQDN